MKRFLPLLLALLPLAVSCDDDSPLPIGSPCNKSSYCDGVCNLALPGGMCVSPCDTVACPDQSTCVDYGEASYCMPTCESNEGCREGYGCVNFTCVPKQPIGALCDDTTDCLACAGQEACPQEGTVECKEGVCAIPCSDQDQCTEGTVCAESSGAYWCIGVYWEQGAGTAGEFCPDGTCADGFTCLSDVKGIESLDFCSMTCTTSRDCPPTMACRPRDDTEDSWCLPREYCETCALSSQCSAPADTCITDSQGAGYCSMLCDPAIEGTCPVDSLCSPTNLCEATGALTDDCSTCSGTCTPTGDSHCYQTARTCTATDGELCDPCLLNAHCATDGGCREDPLSGATHCATLCSPGGICPDGYDCVVSSGDQVCLPRTGSCDAPSGGRETCDTCQEWSQCLRGGCLPLPGDTSGDTFCLNFCQNEGDCPAGMVCENIPLGNETYSACVPDATAVDCLGWQQPD